MDWWDLSHEAIITNCIKLQCNGAIASFHLTFPHSFSNYRPPITTNGLGGLLKLNRLRGGKRVTLVTGVIILELTAFQVI